MKRDNYLFGFLLSVAVPAITFCIVWLISSLLKLPSGRPYFDMQRIAFMALLPNIILIRYYLVNLKADKTGRAIVAVTSIAFLALFVIPNLIH